VITELDAPLRLADAAQCVMVKSAFIFPAGEPPPSLAFLGWLLSRAIRRTDQRIAYPTSVFDCLVLQRNYNQLQEFQCCVLRACRA
jgi:hypothetical protein